MLIDESSKTNIKCECIDIYPSFLEYGIDLELTPRRCRKPTDFKYVNPFYLLSYLIRSTYLIENLQFISIQGNKII